MEKALLISEKPDLMRKMENMYRKHASEFSYEVDFESQSGHLVELMAPDEINPLMKKRGTWDNLPFHPEEYGGWQYKLIDEKFPKQMFAKIKKALKSGKYDFIINDGDPDQEGELLIHNVLDYLGNTLPVKRVWTNDVTEGALLSAMNNLMDDDNDPMLVNLLSAAHAREHSDYRIGMNISRAADLLMHRHDTSCGRVMTPMLKLIVNRECEIRDFKPVTTYGISIRYEEGFEGRLIISENITNEHITDGYGTNDIEAGTVWFDTEEEARLHIQKIKDSDKKIIVDKFESKQVKTYAPKLFKLSSLQAEADRRFGISAGRTLRIVQGLYEKEYVSYPRTGCEYLSSHENFSQIIKALSNVDEYKSFVSEIVSDKSAVPRVRNTKKWINDAALRESGHSALRPTVKAPDISKLTSDEKIIYKLISSRFLAMFLPPMVEERTELISEIDGEFFRSIGKTLIDPGYTRIFGTKFTDMIIPRYSKGDELFADDFSIQEKTTKCPLRYTTGTLISACENPLKYLNDKSLQKLGRELRIGTDATRSGIIEKLIRKGYVEGTKFLAPTETGEQLIDKLEGMIITRVDMTGLWQEKLDKIKSGKMTREEFEAKMMEDTSSMIDEIKKRAEEEEAKIERVELEWNNNKASFRREWGNHRFTDEEVEKLKKGESVTFISTTKSNEEYEFTGMLSGKQKLTFKTTLRKKVGAEYYKGIWRKKEIEFPRDFRGHRLTDDECSMLIDGKEVMVSGLEGRHKGITYSVNIKLSQKAGEVVFATSLAQDPDKEYMSADFKGKKISFCRIWGGHRFTDEECETLLRGDELSLKDLKSKKGTSYGVVGKLSVGKTGNARFIKIRWIRQSGKGRSVKTDQEKKSGKAKTVKTKR